MNNNIQLLTFPLMFAIGYFGIEYMKPDGARKNWGDPRFYLFFVAVVIGYMLLLTLLRKVIRRIIRRNYYEVTTRSYSSISRSTNKWGHSSTQWGIDNDESIRKDV